MEGKFRFLGISCDVQQDWFPYLSSTLHWLGLGTLMRSPCLPVHPCIYDVQQNYFQMRKSVVIGSLIRNPRMQAGMIAYPAFDDVQHKRSVLGKRASLLGLLSGTEKWTGISC